ncbi:MAG TPA: XRE family transcriptional regulator [Trebonia sp.]|nr:XRE family transcriptional regulator [Trebonia sp.]
MTSSRAAAVVFHGPRLTMARRLAGLRKSDLAAQLGMSATAVAAWESGAKRPAAATVARLALSLRVDPGFFEVGPYDIAAQSVTPHFRSPRSTSQLARHQALAYGQLAVDIAASLEGHVESPPVAVPVVGADPLGGDRPEQAAQAVREAWAMPPGPAGHLIRLLEEHGVLVVFSSPQTARVDAYSFASRPRPVVVLSPLRRDYYRQRLDVAHELGHLVMHSDTDPGGRLAEQQADRFAAELMMPAASITTELPTLMGPEAWQVLARLKEQWGVPVQALLLRARTVGRLSEVSYRNAMSTLTARGWRNAEPGRVALPEQPSMLPRAVEQAGPGELIGQCPAPADLFLAITSRVPLSAEMATDTGQDGAPVASLLDSGRRNQR